MRRRVGVALLVERPVADEVDGLRRALGDSALGRVPAHVTLVPPLNLRAGDLDTALARLRVAAASMAGGLRLTLGPPATFLPANPVLYLPVGGDLAGLGRLRSAVSVPPLERASPWPWVPHVTVADEADPDRIAAAVAAMVGYHAVADLDRVVLLEERHGAGGRRWVPLADAALGPAAVVGRGGLELTITRGRVAGPDLLAVVAAAGEEAGAEAGAGRPDPVPGPGGAAPIVLTAGREGACVGGAAAWWAAGRPQVAVLVAAGARRAGVGSHLLAHLEAAARDAGWDSPVLHGLGPAGFYRSRSTWVRPTGDL